MKSINRKRHRFFLPQRNTKVYTKVILTVFTDVISPPFQRRGGLARFQAGVVGPGSVFILYPEFSIIYRLSEIIHHPRLSPNLLSRLHHLRFSALRHNHVYY